MGTGGAHSEAGTISHSAAKVHVVPLEAKRRLGSCTDDVRLQQLKVVGIDCCLLDRTSKQSLEQIGSGG